MLIGESNVAIDPAIGGYGVADIYLGEFSPHSPLPGTQAGSSANLPFEGAARGDRHAASRTRTSREPGFSETPPRHAGHAVRPSQYAVDVPQYSLARFRRDGRAPHRELVLILSHYVPTRAQQLLLRRAHRPSTPSTRRRGPVVFN